MHGVVWCSIHLSHPQNMYVLHIRPDHDMMEHYTRRVVDHCCDNARDAGFDIVCRPTVVEKQGVIKSGLRCAAYHLVDNEYRPTAFYMYPRSSISSTPLRLANNVGIIDAGYRGELLAKVDNLGDNPFEIPRHRRLFQICMPDLKPFTVKIVQTLSETPRGEGGFGSTGL